MKGGREHRVPLAPEALALLADRSLLAPAPSATIFLTLGVNALSNELRKIRPDITVHGMRSGFRDWVSDRTSHGREVAEAALVPFYPGTPRSSSTRFEAATPPAVVLSSAAHQSEKARAVPGLCRSNRERITGRRGC